MLARMLDPRLRDLDGACAGTEREDRNADALSDDLQLIDGGRAIDVTGNEKWIFSFFLEMVGKLAGMRRLTGTLKTHHHHNGRRLRRDLQLRGFCAHQGDQLLVDDLDDLLGGQKTFQHRLADGTLGHRFDKFADDLKVYVGLEKRQLDLAHALTDIGLGQLSLAAKLLQRRG